MDAGTRRASGRRSVWILSIAEVEDVAGCTFHVRLGTGARADDRLWRADNAWRSVGRRVRNASANRIVSASGESVSRRPRARWRADASRHRVTDLDRLFVAVAFCGVARAYRRVRGSIARRRRILRRGPPSRFTRAVVFRRHDRHRNHIGGGHRPASSARTLSATSGASDPSHAIAILRAPHGALMTRTIA